MNLLPEPDGAVLANQLGAINDLKNGAVIEPEPWINRCDIINYWFEDRRKPHRPISPLKRHFMNAIATVPFPQSAGQILFNNKLEISRGKRDRGLMLIGIKTYARGNPVDRNVLVNMARRFLTTKNVRRFRPNESVKIDRRDAEYIELVFGETIGTTITLNQLLRLSR